MTPNRDASFWDAVAAHPQVAPGVFMGLDQVSAAPLIEAESSIPLASENGGLIFEAKDHLGFTYELHTLYRPEGWGREVNRHAKDCFAYVFERASVIVTHEQEGQKQTRPPLSFGWRPAGEYKEVGLPRRLKLWILTRDAWMSSPVGRKLQCR